MKATRNIGMLVALISSVSMLAGCSAPILASQGAPVQAPSSGAIDEYFSNWPAEADPALVGRRIANNFVARNFDFQINSFHRWIIYPEVCAWYGALQVAELSKDQALKEQLIGKFDQFLTPEGARRLSPRAHVDYRITGVVPLEIYLLNGEQTYLEIGRDYADKQWATTTPDGITTEARYWADDLYMLPVLQVQAYRATKDPKYLDRVAMTMVAYLDKLQQPSGLFLHSPDSPFYWGRGNGWVAAGMAEVLSVLPPEHPNYARIMQSYKLMMAGLLKYQNPEGLWLQLIEQPDFWPETSGSAMFAFAMVEGVKRGWLDAKTYGPAARKAWLGLVKYVDSAGNIKEVVVGTNKASNEVGPDLEVQKKFYYDRPRKTGDLHGQSPMLWTAAALLR
ncbi:glycoside hydrolase family 88 protein [Steroidobacter sp. S1-65]|uniref:Glycoside hydrolase family 88 protein n=1 Tax=Steroidobacter gossypii TaxID=2805490 RepID=A0ABS1WUX4_9GAMM|nr:glycoside hydrolase family 88 protein [Steroidobacter gossypii]MBM0104767.1 glycoside hydrolase family 88 protein [Steroidobacter gossypii]